MTNGRNSEKGFPSRLGLIGDDTRVVLVGLLQLIVDGSTNGIFDGSIKNCLVDEWGFSEKGAKNVMSALRDLNLVERARGGPSPQYRLMFGTDMNLNEVVDKSLAEWAKTQEASEPEAQEDEAFTVEAEPAITLARLADLLRRRGELADYRDNLAKQLVEADAELALVDGAVRGIDLVLQSTPLGREIAGRLDEFDQMLQSHPA